MTLCQLRAITCFFVLTANLAFGQLATTPRNTRVDAVLRQLGTAFVQDTSRVGISIGIVQNGQTYFYNAGTIEKGKSQPPTKHTIYEIGSISKTIGSLLLAKAVVDKRVSLDDDIRHYLDGDYPNLAYQGAPIKLVHLANMTSELPDNLPDRSNTFRQANPDSVAYLIVKAQSEYTKQNFLNDLRTVKLQAQPGQNSRHSNVAAQLLGYIVEKIYQRPYAELVQNYIEKPLAMNSSFALDTHRLAHGYNEKGALMPAFAMKEMQAVGGLRYSTADMLNYVAYQLDERNAAVKLSHQPTWGSPDGTATGLNWFVSKTVDSKRQIWQSGSTFGFTSYCVFYPDQHVGLILLANESDQTTQDRLRELSEKIMLTLYGEPVALKDLNAALKSRGYAQVVAVVNDMKKKHPELHLSEEYVNNWGYSLVWQNKLHEAIEIFKLNVKLYPDGFNTYDSLADAYSHIGNHALALDNYKRSLALNPQNANAIEYIKKTADQTGK